MGIIDYKIIEKMAEDALQCDYNGQDFLARQYYKQLLEYSKGNRVVFKKIERFGLIGKAFIFMAEQNVTEDVNDIELICKMAYLFNSKNILTNGYNNYESVTYRLQMLFTFEDFFPDILKDALKIKISQVDMLSRPIYVKLRLKEALYMMRISDFDNKLCFYHGYPFLVQKKKECDELIDTYFTSMTKVDLIKKGMELHDKLITYLDDTLN